MAEQFYEKAYDKLLEANQFYNLSPLRLKLEGSKEDAQIMTIDQKKILYSDFKSPLERVFWVMLIEHTRLKQKYEKRINLIDGYDFVWIYQCPCKEYFIDFVVMGYDKRLAIEIDGFAYHDRDKKQFEYERERQNEILANKFHLLRYTHDKIINDFNAIYDEIEIFILDKILIPRLKKNNEVHN